MSHAVLRPAATALRAYTPELVDPRDFDEFWAVTLAESRAANGEIRLQRIEGEITQLVVEDLTFAGEPIRAWVTRPLEGVEPLPTVIEYVGYGGGRGLPFERHSRAGRQLGHRRRHPTRTAPVLRHAA